MAKNALEPFWEARFEKESYGFRPGRGCHDAIEKIFGYLRSNKSTMRWALDADIKGAFNEIDHDFLLATVGNFPARELVKQWLKAGYMEDIKFHATDSGTPQGGLCKALHNPPYAKKNIMKSTHINTFIYNTNNSIYFA